MNAEQEMCEEGETKAEKKIRRRTTNLYKAIREQMEFYFSDSNLLHDKFLQETIKNSEDGFIDVELFMTFNKIRALTKEPRDVANAVMSSNIIQVNENKTKLRRILPVIKRENIDDCTIYVERLPSAVDHDWLKAVFSNFGTVLYVSLPRFKPSGKPKGFSFIEFETPESAKKACQYFMTHDDEIERQENLFEDEIDIQSNDIENQKHLKENSSKRKQSDDDDDLNEKVKRQKIEDSDISKKDSLNSEKPKKKKHRKRDKHKKKIKQEIEIDDLALRVMSKREWKSWKNKYLSLQKKAMTEIKQKLFLNNHSVVNNNRNEQEKEETIKENSKCKTVLEYQPGVIIKVTCENPISEVSKFKEKINQLGNVAYVDVNKDNTTAYIRCQNAENAKKIVENNCEDIGEMSLLTGVEENSYWEKIKTDKEKSYQSRKRKGRTKIISKVEKTVKNKHIRFDD